MVTRVLEFYSDTNFRQFAEFVGYKMPGNHVQIDYATSRATLEDPPENVLRFVEQLGGQEVEVT